MHKTIGGGTGTMRQLLGSTRILYGSAAILLVVPFFIFRDIPLYDLPTHIAHLEIMFAGGAPDATRHCTAEWRLIPNLAAEAWVFVVHQFVPVVLAVRLFFAVTVAQ